MEALSVSSHNKVFPENELVLCSSLVVSDFRLILPSIEIDLPFEDICIVIYSKLFSFCTGLFLLMSSSRRIVQLPGQVRHNQVQWPPGSAVGNGVF